MRVPDRPKVERVCRRCGENFMEFQSRIDSGKGIYCSKACYQPQLPPQQAFDLHVNRNGPVSEFRPDLGPCWKWAHHIQNKGYGVIAYQGGTRLAHVFSWELVNGPVPEGLELDHLCRVRDCCNPSHLEPVTHRENMLRSLAPVFVAHRSGKCIRGHLMTPENSQVRKNGRRYCRACQNKLRRDKCAMRKAK